MIRAFDASELRRLMAKDGSNKYFPFPMLNNNIFP